MNALTPAKEVFLPNTEGIFELSEAFYRSAPGISQSAVKSFAAEPTPEHYQQLLTEPDEPTAAMEFGTVIHHHVLQPETASESFWERPSTYSAEEKKGVIVDKPWSGNSNWCKGWLATHADRPVLKREAIEKLPAIIAKVNELSEAGGIIRNGKRELCFFKNDPETGALLKCRVDAIATDKSGTTWVVDLKKVRRGFASVENFSVEVHKRGYDVQAASYQFITGADRFLFVAIEDEAPFGVQQHELDGEFRDFGFRRWRESLKRYLHCAETNEWPGYAPGIRRISAPKWAWKGGV